MKNILFLLIAFFYSGFAYSQDSAERKAVAKQGVINSPSETNTDRSKLDQSARGAVSVNSTDTIPYQTTGDYNDKRRITNNESGVKDEPK